MSYTVFLRLRVQRLKLIPAAPVAKLLSEERLLDQQLASAPQRSDGDVMERQQADLSAAVSHLSECVTKARDALQAAQKRAEDRAGMQNEEYNSTMAEVVHLDRESQQLESLLEQERMEVEALKFKLGEHEKQMLVD